MRHLSRAEDGIIGQRFESRHVQKRRRVVNALLPIPEGEDHHHVGKWFYIGNHDFIHWRTSIGDAVHDVHAAVPPSLQRLNLVKGFAANGLVPCGIRLILVQREPANDHL
ncbi:hypothetical protein SDC9_153737 [bioreactor metagenome]|uniref:Uncharacterized protein n=1 Tax=bioreactor metagenome TaxID=1076179 RepID=A0A645EWS7_9ZZZZ